MLGATVIFATSEGLRVATVDLAVVVLGLVGLVAALLAVAVVVWVVVTVLAGE